MSSPLAIGVDDKNIVIFMLVLNMLPYVSLDFAYVIAIRTFESRLLTALVAKVACQIPLPREDTATIWIRTRELQAA